MYHRIAREFEQNIHPYYRVVTTPEVFSKHMDTLADEGYQVIGLDVAVNMLRRESNARQVVPAKPVVITFDDGFHDFYTDGFPILCRHGFTATVFLPTSFINHKDRKIAGKSFLSWSEVRELNKGGITFGSHSVSHDHLVKMPRTEVELELKQSKETIEEMTGSAVLSFSYPFAFPENNKKFVSFLHDALKYCGYSCAVTTSIGTADSGQDTFFLRRIPVNSDDDSALFQAKLGGQYNWLHDVQYISKSVRDMLGLHRVKSMTNWNSSL